MEGVAETDFRDAFSKPTDGAGTVHRSVSHGQGEASAVAVTVDELKWPRRVDGRELSSAPQGVSSDREFFDCYSLPFFFPLLIGRHPPWLEGETMNETLVALALIFASVVLGLAVIFVGGQLSLSRQKLNVRGRNK